LSELIDLELAKVDLKISTAESGKLIGDEGQSLHMSNQLYKTRFKQELIHEEIPPTYLLKLKLPLFPMKPNFGLVLERIQ
jgi:hypothetical protein